MMREFASTQGVRLFGDGGVYPRGFDHLWRGFCTCLRKAENRYVGVTFSTFQYWQEKKAAMEAHTPATEHTALRSPHPKPGYRARSMRTLEKAHQYILVSFRASADIRRHYYVQYGSHQRHR